ncbi:RanBP2-type domain-containing protein [Mycena venus]|uniref:RanBP2-type domain-containing protein n=1 Tax=Mycena venus TaxID=2733690 RepID=A0A8H6U1L2_9AGAR|nr:RanBP2-type domain-containing protein [Mycena venus]
MLLPSKDNSNFNTVLRRLQGLSIASGEPHSLLGPPFSFSDSKPPREGAPPPRPAPTLDLSPQSSTSSWSEFGSVSSGHDSFDSFVSTLRPALQPAADAPFVFVFYIFATWPCTYDNVDLACAGSRSKCLGGISNASRGKTPEIFSFGDDLDPDLGVGGSKPRDDRAAFLATGAQPPKRASRAAHPSFLYQPRIILTAFLFSLSFSLQACAALALSDQRMSVAAALESDLEPFSNLKSFQLGANNAVLPQLYLRPEEFTISSNPPNPRTSFRLGDWICRSQNCAAHNFGRNLTCIGCGCPRSPTATSAAAANDTPQSPHHFSFQTSNLPSHSSRPQLSPRFASASNNMQYPANLSPTGYGFPQQQQPSPSYNRAQHQHQQAIVTLPPPSPLPSPTANKSMPAHPLLTPSGRAFAVGGKVQNISSDPLSPCIMYWPDNEPFPEQGQIRPGGLMGVPQPPILNTGNRGPISHQPGDWICLKCNYLNWRRRKVCQTCLPYAEGNGDSISAAVQAERIALLTSAGRTPPPPAQTHRPFVNFSPPPQQSRGPVHRSQSHSELGSQYMHGQGYPIYQTSPHPAQQFSRHGQLHHPSPLSGQRSLSGSGDYGSALSGSPVDVFAPAPLLPSFLADIVQSPALSPSSTSSADLSLDEYEESLPSSTRSTFSQSGADASPLANIWRLDGEESKSLAAFPLARQELITGRGSASSSRNPSLERLRGLHLSSS